MKISKDAEYIINKLNQNGYEAYIVGGCVRDSVLGVEPKDWDITTSALPNEVKRIFPHTYDTGIQHGTVTVVIDKKNYEVTTYRIETGYSDFRHPERVIYTEKIEEDLSRRDFTMNAIAYNSKDGFKDPFDGIGDIKKRCIRGVGNADRRFNEDALRMLRAVRFSAQLDFEIERETFDAIKKNAELIKNISMERIRDEFTKLILSKNPERLVFIKDTGLLDFFFEELSKRLEKERELITSALKEAKRETSVLYAITLSDVDEKKAEEVMKRFKFDTKTVKEVKLIIRWFNTELKDDKLFIRRLASKLQKRGFELLTAVWEAFARAKNDILRLELIKKAHELFLEIEKSGDCLTLKELAINGEDLKELGIERGKAVGEYLNRALEFVLEFPEKNTKEEIIKAIQHN